MQYSGLQIFSFFILLAGTGLIIVSIGTNYWSYDNYVVKENQTESFEWAKGRRGLWEQCYYTHSKQINEIVDPERSKLKEVVFESCKNRYEELVQQLSDHDFKIETIHTKFHVWEVVCLGFLCGSALLSIFLLVLSPCCCNKCGCCLSVFVFIAALLSCTCIAVYTYHQMAGLSTGKTDTMEILIDVVPEFFGYSFWCAVAGASCQLLSSIIFAAARKRVHTYSHTI